MKTVALVSNAGGIASVICRTKGGDMCRPTFVCHSNVNDIPSLLQIRCFIAKT
jgi:hypothetical protein